MEEEELGCSSKELSQDAPICCEVPAWSSRRRSAPNGCPRSRSAAALAALMLLWNPPVGDLAAQVFRTELFEHAGLAIWNGSWYGGHYTLNYSLLFPPAAALLGPQVVGLPRGRRLLLPLRPPGPRPLGGGGALGDALVRGRRRHPARRRPADLRPRRRLRAGGAALRCRSGRGRARGPRRRGLPAGQPGRRRLPRRRRRRRRSGNAASAAQPRRDRRRRRWRSSSPSPPTSPSPNRAASPSSSPPSSRSRSGARAPSSSSASRRSERQLRRVIIGYGLASTLIFLTPNALGGNAVRLGALFGGPVLAAVAALARRARAGPVARRSAGSRAGSTPRSSSSP